MPVIIALYVLMQKRRSKYALRYASVALVSQAVGKGPGMRRHIPAALYITAIAAMIIGLARPTATVPIPRTPARSSCRWTSPDRCWPRT